MTADGNMVDRTPGTSRIGFIHNIHIGIMLCRSYLSCIICDQSCIKSRTFHTGELVWIKDIRQRLVLFDIYTLDVWLRLYVISNGKLTDLGQMIFYDIIIKVLCHLFMIILTHHDWPSQMHENLLIGSQNTSDSECFDAANQQIWVHLWGPCVMRVYYIMIIIKISKKNVF